MRRPAAAATSGGERQPRLEPRALDSVNDHPGRQAAERARELERLGEAETVRGDAEQLRRQPPVASFEPVQLARRGSRADGIHDPDLAGVLAELDQLERLTLVLDDLDAARPLFRDRGSDEKTGRVVPAPAVADADQPQARSISSFRKCVAQEMQGS